MTKVAIGKVVPQRPGSDVGHAEKLAWNDVDFDWGLKGVSKYGWHSPICCFIRGNDGWEHQPAQNVRGDWTYLALESSDRRDIPLEIDGDDLVVDLDDLGELDDDEYLTIVTVEAWSEDRHKYGWASGDDLLEEARSLFPMLNQEDIEYRFRRYEVRPGRPGQLYIPGTEPAS